MESNVAPLDSERNDPGCTASDDDISFPPDVSDDSNSGSDEDPNDDNEVGSL